MKSSKPTARRRAVAKPSSKSLPKTGTPAAPSGLRAASADPVVQSIVSAVRKRVKGSTIATLDQSSALSDVKEFIPSGFVGLDHILGGGWAVGRASEVFGDEGCGKSALAHMAIKGVQQMGGYAVLLDFEAALDESKILQLGIDTSRLVYEIPDHAERGWDIIWAIMDQLKEKPPDAPVLIVWDSIGGAIPKAELEDSTSEKAHVGEIARIMSRGCRRMFKAIATARAHVMWIAQERHKIGGFSPFGPVKETSGGKGPKYAASQRVRCAKVKTLKAGKGRSIGYQIKSITKKNRLAAPEQFTEWVIDFRVGPSPDLSTLQVLQDAGVVRSVKGKLVLRGLEESFTRDTWVELLARNKEARSIAEAALRKVIGAGGALAVRDRDAEEVVDESDDDE